eukprot:m.756519 g.756519  ORF g.756519 m.756519 type:complete len:183 (-) comp23184_c0_seq10:2501-3049(-)
MRCLTSLSAKYVRRRWLPSWSARAISTTKDSPVSAWCSRENSALGHTLTWHTDWHAVTGDYGAVVKHFAGASCVHWTTENTTNLTRVSLDFRLIAGPMFHAFKCGGAHKGGQLDVYRQPPGGYYSRCELTDGGWTRVGDLAEPDARIGFPWTVKNWEKYLRKKRSGKEAKANSEQAACQPKC